ncbi:MAG: 50S ribosomal protein L5 [bacterium]|nr:50S ribosomal protein L5 [bacterium]
MARLLKQYQEKVIPLIMENFSYKNVMQVSKLEKIVINIGLGEAKDNPRSLEIALEELSVITGQKPVACKAKKSVSNFKLREGMTIGSKVTLRKEMMYEFLDRLITIAIPRIRDFQGLNPKAFDSCGNYNLGITEQYIFPEVNLDNSDKARGMNITFVFSKDYTEENKEILLCLGMPFKKKREGV